MGIYYFDTDALSWRYMDSSNIKLRAPDIGITKSVNAIVEEKENSCYISEFVLLEWTSVMGKRVRSQEVRSFDYEWAKKNEQALMQDIVAHRLKVLPSIPRIVEHARVLVDRIGVYSKRALITVDAVHLIYAIQLAQAKGCKIFFVSCDGQLLGVIRDFGPVSRFLNIHRAY